MLFKMLFKNFLLIILLFSLTACNTLTVNPSKTSHAPTPRLGALTAWVVQGNLSAQSAKKGVNLSFYWKQEPQAYQVHLFGPFGSYHTQIIGHDHAPVSLLAGSKVFYAPTVELLTQQQLGLRLPLENLYYWVRGLPSPHASFQASRDEHHRLVQLNQNGWQLNYLSYTSVKGMELPRQIQLSHAPWRVSLFITQWQF